MSIYAIRQVRKGSRTTAAMGDIGKELASAEGLPTISNGHRSPM